MLITDEDVAPNATYRPASYVNICAAVVWGHVRVFFVPAYRTHTRSVVELIMRVLSRIKRMVVLQSQSGVLTGVTHINLRPTSTFDAVKEDQ